MSPLPYLLDALKKEGRFVNVEVMSIGRFVFPGWGAWNRVVHEEESFGEEVVQAWLEGALDYWVVTAQRAESN